jgi:hypothetical protein
MDWEDGYLTVTHQVLTIRQRRYYVHRFVYFEMTMTPENALRCFIRRISYPFYFFQKDVEYCNGMCLDPEDPAGSVLLGVGLKDREAYLIRISVKSIQEMLYDLSELQAEENPQQ